MGITQNIYLVIQSLQSPFTWITQFKSSQYLKHSLHFTDKNIETKTLTVFDCGHTVCLLLSLQLFPMRAVFQDVYCRILYSALYTEKKGKETTVEIQT